MTDQSLLDVAIIGGGPAGLTAASSFARQLHTAVVFDNKSYRNSKASHMHMVPTWNHGDPAKFRKEARQEVQAGYETIQFADVEVATVKKEGDSLFKVTDAAGKEWGVRKVLLAVGSAESYPEIEGYEALWTKRIFHCLFCHGYEDRGAKSAGLLAVFPLLMPALVMHMAENAAQLSSSVTIYTNGNQELAAQLAPSIAAASNSVFTVEPRPIKQLVEKAESESLTVEFADGSGSREEKFLVHSPMTSVKGPFVGQLGLETSPMGDILADAPFHQTNVRGVFAAGDCITPYKVIPGAISSGCNAAVAASAQLQSEKHGQTPMF